MLSVGVSYKLVEFEEEMMKNKFDELVMELFDEHSFEDWPKGLSQFVSDNLDRMSAMLELGYAEFTDCGISFTNEGINYMMKEAKKFIDRIENAGLVVEPKYLKAETQKFIEDYSKYGLGQNLVMKFRQQNSPYNSGSFKESATNSNIKKFILR